MLPFPKILFYGRNFTLKARRHSIGIFCMAILLCLSAMTVAFTSAAAASKDGASFTVASATDGKITLTDMKPGIYEVSVKGTAKTTSATSAFGFMVEETGETFVTSPAADNFASADAYTAAFPCVLVEGTNTLILHAGADAAITDYKLELIEELATADTVHYTPSKTLNEDGRFYVKVDCPAAVDTTGTVTCTHGEAGHKFHYYKAFNNDADRWLSTDTCYYSVNELPNKNQCYIRDCTVQESATDDYYAEIDVIENNAKYDRQAKCYIVSGTNKITIPGAMGFDSWDTAAIAEKSGAMLMRNGTELRITVNAPKTGAYRILFLYADSDVLNAGLFSVTVNDDPTRQEWFYKEDPEDGKDVDRYPAFHNHKSATAGTVANYGELGKSGSWNFSVYLDEGENVITLSLGVRTYLAWAQIPTILFNMHHAHDEAGTIYSSDAEGHWRTCSGGCNQNRYRSSYDFPYETAKLPHGAGVDDGDCTTGDLCPDCGYELTKGRDEHTGGTATCTEKAKCTVCGKAYGSTLSHTGGTATCTARKVCTVCGNEYGSKLQHVYTVTESDDTEHWEKCENCDATRKKGEHEGGTATCSQKAVCDVCGKGYGDTLAHTYAYKSEDGKHRQECSVCGGVTEKADHAYGEDKKCVCGAEKTGCGASIAASAIAVTAVLGLGIGFIRKKKED